MHFHLFKQQIVRWHLKYSVLHLIKHPCVLLLHLNMYYSWIVNFFNSTTVQIEFVVMAWFSGLWKSVLKICSLFFFPQLWEPDMGSGRPGVAPCHSSPGGAALPYKHPHGIYPLTHTLSWVTDTIGHICWRRFALSLFAAFLVFHPHSHIPLVCSP